MEASGREPPVCRDGCSCWGCRPSWLRLTPERLRSEAPSPGSRAGLWDLSAGSRPEVRDSALAPALPSASVLSVPASALGSLSPCCLSPGPPRGPFTLRGSPRAPAPHRPAPGSAPRGPEFETPLRTPTPTLPVAAGRRLPRPRSAPLQSAPPPSPSSPPPPPPLSGRGQRRRAARGAGPHTAPVPRGRAGRRAPPSLRFPSLPLPPMAALGGTARLAAAAAAQRGAAAAAL